MGIRRLLPRSLLGLIAAVLAAGAVTMAGEAQAQSGVCQQISAELASLPRDGGGARHGRQAAQARARLGRVQSNMAALGCNRGFVLFGPQPPAECGGLRAQAAALQSSIAQLDGAAQGGGSARRRAQLMASYSANNCGARRVQVAQPVPQPQMERQPTFLEAIFGRRTVDAPRYATEDVVPAAPVQDQRKKAAKTEDGDALKVRYGGQMPICVRTCDGFFFPVNYRGSEDQHGDVCRASCPGVETQLYWMSAGADLDTARAPDGARYNALPAAYSYRKSYDPACSCKSAEQTWGSVLQKAESLIKERGTTIVTDESSLRMARPNAARDLRGVRDAEEKLNAARDPQAAQTAPRFVEHSGGVTIETKTDDGTQRTVRVLTPGVAIPLAAPQTAEQ